MPTTSGSSSHPPITLKEKVEFLKQTGSYPDRPAGVETIETHMAFVFLTDRFAYKLKKPVRLDFLDFSTLEARRRNCEAEVLLNRRLAPDLYIGMIPLTVNLQRELQLGEEEEVVDWLVKMHRLPGERMLDYVIRHDTVREEDIRRVASVLSSFYTSSPLSTSARRNTGSASRGISTTT